MNNSYNLNTSYLYVDDYSDSNTITPFDTNIVNEVTLSPENAVLMKDIFASLFLCCFIVGFIGNS